MEGAVGSAYVTGAGAAFRFRVPTTTFDPTHPDTLLYDGTGPNAQVAGLEWNVASEAAPDGFVGDNDVWSDKGGGVWRLRAWMLRPFQNEVDVFAETHPCLGSSGPIYDVSHACYTSTHPNPLQVLVSNDDGYGAAGIDAVVKALVFTTEGARDRCLRRRPIRAVRAATPHRAASPPTRDRPRAAIPRQL